MRYWDRGDWCIAIVVCAVGIWIAWAVVTTSLPSYVPQPTALKIVRQSGLDISDAEWRDLDREERLAILGQTSIQREERRRKESAE